MSKKGKFIVIEGPDASGKGTIVELLKETYPDFYYTREPGGTAVGERIRNLLLDKNVEMSSLTEAYLYASSRSAFVQHVKSKLDEGRTVVCERYVYSSYVYQGMAGKLGLDLIKTLNDPILDELSPDLLIFLLVTEETRKKRINIRGNLDRMELKEEQYFIDVLNGYRDISNKILEDTDQNVLIINTDNLTPQEIFTKANNTIKEIK